MLASVAWVHGGNLFSSPPLIDEYDTVFLAEKGSFFQSMAHLAAGSDFNPPLLYVVERAIASLTGGITPVSLRITSFVTVWLALVVVFLALRRMLSPSAAFLGSFSLWSNALVVDHAFEGRFYGPWLLLAAMVLWSIGWDAEREVSRRRDLALGVGSAFLCTIHYFGIVSLFLIGIGAAVWIARTGRGYRRLLPMSAGPIALTACAPFFLGQRAALTVKTWIAPVSAHQIREMLEVYVVAAPLVIGLVLLAGYIVWRAVRHTFSQSSFSGTDLYSLPFIALLLMPVVVVFISIVVQPAMLPRYAIPAVLAWAPIIGFSVRPLRWPGKVAIVFVLFFYSVKALSADAAGVENYRSHIKLELSTVTPFLDSGFVVVVPRRSSLYPLLPATLRRSQLVYPDFSDSVARSRGLSASMIFDRDVARVHRRLYGFPTLESIDSLRRRSDVRFFVPTYGTGTAYTLSLLFPDDEVTSIASHIYLVRSRDSLGARVVDDPLHEAMKLLYVNRDPAKALGVLDQLLSTDLGHYGALWQRAFALEALGRDAEAIRAWRIVISEAEQYGWRDGLVQAQARLRRLECSSSWRDNPDRRASFSGSIIRWYRCHSNWLYAGE